VEARAERLEREREERARRAVAAERARIARELHDVVAHAISVTVVQARGGRRILDSDVEQARTAFDSIERTGEHGFWPELRAGVHHIAHTADLRRLTAATAFVTLAAGVMEVAIFALIDQGLHRPPEFLGVLSTAQGVGAVVGGVVVGATIRKIGEFSTITWALVSIAVGVGMLAWATLPIVLMSAVAIGVAVSFFNVAFVTLIQRRTDVAMQGRVMSAVEAVFTVPYAASIAAGAVLISVVSFRTIYLAQAVMFLVLAGYLALTARDRPTRQTPSRGRKRRRARDRSSSRDGRALAAPPQRFEDPRPTP